MSMRVCLQWDPMVSYYPMFCNYVTVYTLCTCWLLPATRGSQSPADCGLMLKVFRDIYDLGCLLRVFMPGIRLYSAKCRYT